MKIKTFGAKHFTGQLPRIEKGFKELGHEIVGDTELADLIYANDPSGFSSAFYYKTISSNHPKLIFNIQDIPRHLLPNYDLEGLYKQLVQADRITSISKTTQRDVRDYLELDSDIIYQPTMPVFQTNEKKYDYKYLIAGRNSDPNKRNFLARSFLRKYEPTAKVAVVGSEDAIFGDYFGIVSNEALNDLYNSVDYVFSLTKYGGIELSQIEAVLAGKFPIVATDSDVAMEFNPEFACDPTPEGIREKILEIEANQVKYKEIVERKKLYFSTIFDKIEVAKKILELVE